MFSNTRFRSLRKAISSLLVGAMVVTLWPAQAMATVQTPMTDPPVPKPEKREVIEYRDAHSKWFDNGDGTLTRHIAQKPVHVKKGDKWESISTKLTFNSDVSEVAPEMSELNLKFKPVMTNGKYLDITRGSHKVEFTFLGSQNENGNVQPNNVKAVFEKNKLTYPNVLDGVDLRQIVFNQAVKEDIILSKYNGMNTFRFAVATDLEMKKEDDGAVALIDAAGEEILSMPAPHMIDSNFNELSGDSQQSTSVSYEVAKEGEQWILTVEADDAWLKDPTRKYPVFIDPFVHTGDSSDAYVHQK